MSIHGRQFFDAYGASVPQIMASGFPLPKMVGDGREPDVRAFLQFLRDEGVWFVRTLSAWKGTSITQNQFTPQQGLQWMPRLLDIAQEIGIYVMPVGVVDSGLFGSYNWPQHLQTLGNMCAGAEMPLENGQEIPHSTQLSSATLWVKNYKPPVVYCEGSVHGANDMSMALSGGNFICTHVLRGVEQVARHRQVAAVFRPTGKPFISMEPERTMDANTWYAVAKECRKNDMGLTFHSAMVRDGKIPVGGELSGLRSMVRGMTGG